jgi:hypothetical protein
MPYPVGCLPATGLRMADLTGARYVCGQTPEAAEIGDEMPVGDFEDLYDSIGRA